MGKRFFAVFLGFMISVCVQAQVEVWKTIASAPRNMQIGEYGKAMPLSIEIIKDGTNQVLIDTVRYLINDVSNVVKTDSIESVELSVKNWENKEYIIKFNKDLYAESNLMRYCIIVFAANDPYHWTYYFCKKPE